MSNRNPESSTNSANHRQPQSVEWAEIRLNLTGYFKVAEQAEPVTTTEVEAVEGVETGLAFHLALMLELELESVEAEVKVEEKTGSERELEKKAVRHELSSASTSEFEEVEVVTSEGGGYNLTHLQSGLSLGYRTVDTPRQARVWLSLVAVLTDWRLPLNHLASNQPALQKLAVQVEQARQDAIARCSYVDEEGTRVS